MYILSFFSSRRTVSHLQLGWLIIIVLLLEALGGGNTYAAHGQAHFDIRPSFFPSPKNPTPRAVFIYNNYAGALIRDSLQVKNNGTARGTITIYPADAMTSKLGGEAYPTHNGPQHDIGAWITLSYQRITLNPGQSLDIPFTLRIPEHVRPGQHLGGIVALEPEGRQTSSQGTYRTIMTIQPREIIGVLVNLPGTRVEKLQATRVAYNGASSAYQSVLVGLKNTGTQFLHPTGSLQILNAKGQILQNVPIKLDTFLPQTAIDYPVYMHRHALVPGTYQAILSLQYEHGHMLNYKTSFVIPFSQLSKNTAISQTISDLVTPDGNFFKALTPLHYVIGMAFLFLLLSALFFWVRSAYRTTIKLKKKLDGRKPKNAQKDE